MAVARRDERRAERVAAELPVRMRGSVIGTTRNLSASGVYFLTERSIGVGQPLRFDLDLASVSGALSLVCEGVALRVEDAEGIRGVAVSLETSYLKRKL